MKTTAPLLLVLSLSAPSAIHAQTELRVPLGLLSHADVVSWEREPDSYAVVLENVMPGARYVVSSMNSYTPLEAPKKPVTTAEVDAIAKRAATACETAVRNYVLAANAATDEAAVAAANRSALAAAGNCIDYVATAIAELTTIGSSQAGQTAAHLVKIRRKFLTTIRIQRTAAGGDRDWEIEITTGPGAAWLTMPILAAVHDEGEEWFSQADPIVNDDGTTEERYLLVREDRGFDIRPGAGVGFFLVPESQRQKNFFSHSFMAGFGLNDSKTPLLFMLGYSLLFGDHVTATLGVAGTWEPDRLGRYTGVTHVSENLTNDQITTEELVARPFFSIGIDFDGFDLSPGKKPKDSK